MKKFVIASISFIPALFLSGQINLRNQGDCHIFENRRCSEVNTSEITIDGREFDASRDRLSRYGNGAIVIADGWSNPLTVYKQENCSGESLVLQYDRYYRSETADEQQLLPEESLGGFDNSIRSFRLKRGFSCTMANNPDGTGYSRVFIADDDDLIVNQMPEGLDFVSFIRVCRHDWTGKRGFSGGEQYPELTRSAWFYDWGAGASSSADCEYVPMRHNRWWDSWENIASRTETASVLGFNEPDHADQSDLGTEIAIDLWPEFMKSGLRIGSPAPDNINKQWLREFLAKADSLNYRVDFVATHMYWDSQDPYALANTISDLCRNSYGGRPMWITEWNNGANWTNEYWPDQHGPQRDADFNIIPDENGNTVDVPRPHTRANSEVQCRWLEKALDAFDKCPWLERHAFYNWVEDARAIDIGDKLTPAGQIFADFNSRPAFNRECEYIHHWRIAPPRIKGIRYSNKRVRIDFYDHNGETCTGYTVQRRTDGLQWEDIAFIEPGKDYKQGRETFFRDFDVPAGLVQYRFKARSYKDTESIWSRIVSIRITSAGTSDITAGSTLGVTACGSSIIIESQTPGTTTLYTADGRPLRHIYYSTGKTAIENLPHGVYIIARQKIML